MIVTYEYGTDTPPLAQAAVTLGGSQGQTSKAGDDGQLVFDNLPPADDYTIRVESADGNLPGNAGPIKVISNQVTDVPITVKPRGIIRGRAVDSTNPDDSKNGVSGATVTLDGQASGSVKSGGNGEFEFKFVESGHHDLKSTIDQGFVHADAGLDPKFRPNDVVPATLKMRPLFIAGTVTDAATTNPIPGATVKVAEAGVAAVTTDGSGNYKIVNLKEGVTYHVSAFKEGLADGNDGHATVNPTDKTDPVNLKLRKMKVVPNSGSITVVVDKAGNTPSGFPILTFTITDGPPNQFFDLQVTRDGSTPAGGPGISGAWDATKNARDRQNLKVYSSWTDGKTSLKLDGSGGATFAMPLEWWRDLARIPLASFSSAIAMKYRVIAFPDPASPPAGTTDPAASPSLEVKNNLISFTVVDNGYIDGGIKKSINMKFTVREAGTTKMYTFVQWMQGYFKRWQGPGSTPVFPAPHTLYDIQHISNFPDFTIDRLHTDPRYHDDAYTISADLKTATSDDAPSQGHVVAPFTHYYSSIDFETRVHLNFDVPAAVNVYKKEGTGPVFGVVSGNMNPDPITLSSQTWNTHVLEVLSGSTLTVTHDATFAGP